MKRPTCIILAACMIASALLYAGCAKKHTIDTDLALADSESISGAAGVIYENVTDKNGENVTNAEGETVTVAVPAESTTAGATQKSGDTTTKKNETTTKKTETTTKKTETTTKKGETTTKKGETTTAKKTETTTAKKAETTTKKTEPTTKTPETTTAKPATTAAPEIKINDGEYVLTLSPDKTEVKPGDTVTLTLHLKNCKNIACFNIIFRSGGAVTVNDDKDTNKNYKSNRFATEDGDNFTINANNIDGEVQFAGMISTTYDFLDDDLCTVTYKVSPDAKSGDTLVFAAVPTQLLVGTSDSGDATQDYSDVLNVTPLQMIIK